MESLLLILLDGLLINFIYEIEIGDGIVSVLGRAFRLQYFDALLLTCVLNLIHLLLVSLGHLGKVVDDAQHRQGIHRVNLLTKNGHHKINHWQVLVYKFDVLENVAAHKQYYEVVCDDTVYLKQANQTKNTSY